MKLTQLTGRWDDEDHQALDMKRVDLELVTLVAYDRDDTFDRCAAAEGGPIADILWLALHGNSTARRVVDAMTTDFTEQIIAEHWPGERASSLRADRSVRLIREIRQRMSEVTERHAWRWN